METVAVSNEISERERDNCVTETAAVRKEIREREIERERGREKERERNN